MNTIEKQILLKAPLGRVWRAISDSSEFGEWFGVRFAEAFKAGQPLTGEIQPTAVDPEVAKLQEAHKGLQFNIQVEEIQPEHLFSFRWHPFGIDKSRDYSAEPMTLVEFRLEPKAEGVLLTITESGFDQIPEDRRAEAYNANNGGWTKQTELIQKYVEG